jgi:hypothetical protein
MGIGVLRGADRQAGLAPAKGPEPHPAGTFICFDLNTKTIHFQSCMSRQGMPRHLTPITFAKSNFRKIFASPRPRPSGREKKKHHRALVRKYFWQSVQQPAIFGGQPLLSPTQRP